MKAAALARAKHKKETVDFLLEELAEECERYLELYGKLQGKRNGKIKRSDVLADMNASVTHLHIHTKGMSDLICEEFDREEDD